MRKYREHLSGIYYIVLPFGLYSRCALLLLAAHWLTARRSQLRGTVYGTVCQFNGVEQSIVPLKWTIEVKPSGDCIPKIEVLAS